MSAGICDTCAYAGAYACPPGTDCLWRNAADPPLLYPPLDFGDVAAALAAAAVLPPMPPLVPPPLPLVDDSDDDEPPLPLVRDVIDLTIDVIDLTGDTDDDSDDEPPAPRRRLRPRRLDLGLRFGEVLGVRRRRRCECVRGSGNLCPFCAARFFDDSVEGLALRRGEY